MASAIPTATNNSKCTSKAASAKYRIFSPPHPSRTSRRSKSSKPTSSNSTKKRSTVFSRAVQVKNLCRLSQLRTLRPPSRRQVRRNNHETLSPHLLRRLHHFFRHGKRQRADRQKGLPLRLRSRQDSRRRNAQQTHQTFRSIRR